MERIWTRITDYTNYWISSDGKIFNENNQGKNVPTYLNHKGYKVVGLYNKLTGKTDKLRVARLVATEFIRTPESKEQVNHKDGDKTNNKIENLEWVSNTQNRKHAVENKLHAYGERHHKSKLKQKDINYIRNNYPKMTQKKLALKYNIDKSIISKIVNNKIWRLV